MMAVNKLEHFVSRDSLSHQHYTFLDIHLHTNKSPDSRIEPETVLQNAAESRLDFIAFTEHDPIRDPQQLQSLERVTENSIKIIPAIEVTTYLHGLHYPHIILLNADAKLMDEYLGSVRLPYLRRNYQLESLFDWIDHMRKLGLMDPLVVAAHPIPDDFVPLENYSLKSWIKSFTSRVTSLTFSEIRRYADMIDAIEIINEKHNSIDEYRLALAHELGKPGVGGSDSHNGILGKVGTYVRGRGKTINQVLDDIRRGEVGTFCDY